MSRTAIAFLITSLALGNLHATPPAPSQFKPSWSPGQSWKIEVERPAEPKAIPRDQQNFQKGNSRFVYQLTVEAATSKNGENCTPLRIDCIAVDGSPATDSVFYRVYLRQSDHTLAQVDRLNLKSGELEAGRSFDSGPVDATDWSGFLPLAFPSFRDDQPQPPGRKSKDGKVQFTHPEGCRQTSESSNARGSNVFNVTLERVQNEGHRITTQTWIKGNPWWTEARQYRDGKEWCSARLLKD
jgi:hypothetical protein